MERADLHQPQAAGCFLEKARTETSGAYEKHPPRLSVKRRGGKIVSGLVPCHRARNLLRCQWDAEFAVKSEALSLLILLITRPHTLPAGDAKILQRHYIRR